MLRADLTTLLFQGVLDHDGLTFYVPFTAAGVAIAARFGLLALVPLDAFRELGFAVAVGILPDVFVVRAVLVPSLLTLVGRRSGWPSNRLARPG